jgi:hypothetical protein
MTDDASRDEVRQDEMMPFAVLLAAVMANSDRFGHRQHVQLTWLAVRHLGTTEAIRVVSDGIQRTARYEGNPRKYNATVSRAWVELVGFHAIADPTPDFDEFAERNPALFDKRLLLRFYRSSTLASEPARSGWVAPDAAAFPWQDDAEPATAADAGVAAPTDHASPTRGHRPEDAGRAARPASP